MSFTHDYSSEYSRFRGRLNHRDIVADFSTGLAALLTGLGVEREPAEAIGRSLLGRMSDARLRYHSPLHVLSMLSWAERHGIELAPWQELAVWFHDAVYKPRSVPGDNEALSARLAGAMLTGFLGNAELARVQRGVRATGLHLKRSVPADVAIIIDLDVCSFAWDRTNFLASSLALAEELVPVVGQQGFRAGRRKFLAELLAKGFVYRTRLFRERFEQSARDNILYLLENEPEFRPGRQIRQPGLKGGNPVRRPRN